MTKNSLLDNLNQSQGKVEQAARCIYYAMSMLELGSPAKVNLDLALQELGVNHPNDVGLSDRVLSVERRIKS